MRQSVNNNNKHSENIKMKFNLFSFEYEGGASPWMRFCIGASFLMGGSALLVNAVRWW
jgi:hypothetical protein